MNPNPRRYEDEAGEFNKKSTNKNKEERTLRNLPEPKCELGYTEHQVKNIVDDYFDFVDFIRGKVVEVCREDYKCRSCSEPHGRIITRNMLEEYLI